MHENVTLIRVQYGNGCAPQHGKSFAPAVRHCMRYRAADVTHK